MYNALKLLIGNICISEYLPWQYTTCPLEQRRKLATSYLLFVLVNSPSFRYRSESKSRFSITTLFPYNICCFNWSKRKGEYPHETYCRDITPSISSKSHGYCIIPVKINEAIKLQKKKEGSQLKYYDQLTHTVFGLQTKMTMSVSKIKADLL